jgi:hypothetical protein
VARPLQPAQRRAPAVAASEELGEADRLHIGASPHLDGRQGRTSCSNGRFDASDDGLGLTEAALVHQPANRLGQQKQADQADEEGQRSEPQQQAPAQRRANGGNKSEADERREQVAPAVQLLIQKEVLAAAMALDDFGQHGGRDRHFAAQADAGQDAEPQQALEIPGEGRPQAEDAHGQQRADVGHFAAVQLAQYAKQDGARQLANVGQANKQAGLDQADVQCGENDR